jgi:hypothetical protein
VVEVEVEPDPGVLVTEPVAGVGGTGVEAAGVVGNTVGSDCVWVCPSGGLATLTLTGWVASASSGLVPGFAADLSVPAVAAVAFTAMACFARVTAASSARLRSLIASLRVGFAGTGTLSGWAAGAGVARGLTEATGCRCR